APAGTGWTSTVRPAAPARWDSACHRTRSSCPSRHRLTPMPPRNPPTWREWVPDAAHRRSEGCRSILVHDRAAATETGDPAGSGGRLAGRVPDRLHGEPIPLCQARVDADLLQGARSLADVQRGRDPQGPGVPAHGAGAGHGEADPVVR